ncbi:TIGR02646 family protein [Bacillus toyonensis]|uniref:AAA family ATPase n=1 Tax=Bacillus toyonensis TaxID=155322 RepID=UPI000278B7D7|nr:AAA family ATPase [Bacillus toyonensis]EJQ32368.1 TIGR02646 family protein [Bacillus toyonensis]
MISINRGPAPPVLHSKKIKTEIEKMNYYYSLPISARDRSSYETKTPFPLELKLALEDVFQGKCAYCESIIKNVNSYGRINHYRPSKGAYFNEYYSPDHYWWLKYEWSNLYYVCPLCNSKKHKKFPILGKPAPIGAVGSELLSEDPLILDPCSDIPENHLIYNENGEVHSKTRKGQYTISLLGLNREQLVDERKHSLQRFKNNCDTFIMLLGSNLNKNEELFWNSYKNLLKEVDSSSEYCGIKRQFLREWIERDSEYKEIFSNETSSFLNETPLITKEKQLNSNTSFIEHEDEIEDYNLIEKNKLINYYAKQRLVTRIVISNFKSIEKLDIELNIEDDQAPWLMLLGENGSGKSSILQAIALCLMDNSQRKNYQLDASQYLKKEAKSGFVRVYISGSSNPIEIQFNKHSNEFISNQKSQKVLVLGYGDTRLLPNDKHKSPELSISRTENLFDPYSPLIDPNVFLYNLSIEEFHYVRSSLESLLVLKEGESIKKGKKLNQILITTNGATVELDRLSTGFRSVIALTTDIMMAMKEFWKDSKDAQGIVLLDEIDAHLHPRWKLQIVDKLRCTFPRIQFITTSHDPLCLRGLKNHEVAVLRRAGNNKIKVKRHLPNADKFEIDQILTSEYFGLHSTASPEYDKLMKRYYELLSIPNSKRTDDIEKEIEKVKNVLGEFELLGQTPRDQIVYRLLDEYIAKNQGFENEDINKMDDNTKDDVLNLLQKYQLDESEE